VSSKTKPKSPCHSQKPCHSEAQRGIYSTKPLTLQLQQC